MIAFALYILRLRRRINFPNAPIALNEIELALNDDDTHGDGQLELVNETSVKTRVGASEMKSMDKDNIVEHRTRQKKDK